MRKPTFERVVTHEMAREAYSRLHNAHYNGARVPLLTIPPSPNDVDMLIPDYIAQQEAKEAAGTAPTPPQREGFEKWADGYFGHAPNQVMERDGDGYDDVLLDTAWAAWKAVAEARTSAPPGPE